MTFVPSGTPLYGESWSSSYHGLADSPRRDYGDRYLFGLALVLLGYATLGKTFAYIGVPPIFISEIFLLLGVIALIRANCFAASVSTFPALCLIALMAWALTRTIPYISLYGVETLRDSVTLLYGTLALIVTALLLQDARRLNRLVQLYGRFASLMPPIMTVIAVVAITGEKYLPTHPGTGLPIIQLKAGDLAAHLAGVCVFVLLGFCRPGRVWGAFLIAAMLISASLNRGGMLAMALPISLAVIIGGKVRTFAPAVLGVVFCVALAYAADITLPIQDAQNRAVGARQLVGNALSVFGADASSDSSQNLDGTKKWRLAWWQTIQNYTFSGDYFWTGKGFGVNLAESDGFVVGRENAGAPLLRSPHNIHFTILARTGVPGFALWVTTLTAWFATLASAMVAARQGGDRRWSDFFLFLQCYVLAMLINASFDVSLEGPVMAFWFWSLVGTGIGSVMIYRTRPLILAQARPNNLFERSAG